MEDVHKGNLWGYIHIGNNYSQHMIDRLATKQFAFEESIEGSTIRIRMDMSRKKFYALDYATGAKCDNCKFIPQNIWALSSLSSIYLKDCRHMCSS